MPLKKAPKKAARALPHREIMLTFAAQSSNALPRLRPDGGIGRRDGLKHRWSNPCRFDPGSGY